MRSGSYDGEWLGREHPEVVARLGAAIDRNWSGFAGAPPAAELATVADLEACCAAIAASSAGAWLREPIAAADDWVRADPDQLLQNIFTIQDVTASQPCRYGQGLDWHDRGPHQDREWAWLLNRQAWALDLLLAWQERQDERYLRHADMLLCDWLVQNPAPLGHTTSGPWRELEAGLRCAQVLPQFVHATWSAAAVRPVTRILLLDSLRQHARYLRRYHRRQSNHATMEMHGLLSVALTCPFFSEAADWEAYARQVLIEEMAFQVYPDGVQVECTAMYHWVSLRHFDEVVQLYRAAGHDAPAELVDGVERMWSYLADCLRPDGSLPLNNDGDRKDLRPELAAAARRHGRPAWEWAASNGLHGPAPAGPPSRAWPWAGQLISRSGWDVDDHWSFFDLGPWGQSHQHDDHLHLSIHAHGRDLLVDSGRFAYYGELARYAEHYGKRSAGHNVWLVDGCGQDRGPLLSETPLPDNRLQVTAGWDYARSSWSAFRDCPGSVVHTRALLYLRGRCWIVVDRLHSDRLRRYQALWHWHPDCSVTLDGRHCRSADADQGNLVVAPHDWPGEVAIVCGQEDPLQGWYSPTYNRFTAAPTAVYQQEAQDCTTVWIIAAGRGPAVAPAIRSLAERADAVELDLDLAEPQRLVIPLSDAATVSVAPR